MLPITDTHQHLIYPDRYDYGWTQGFPRLAGRAFRHDDYVVAAAGSGIAATIFMEAVGGDPAENDEAAFVGTLAAASGSLIAGIVAACRPEGSGFAAFLDALEGTAVVGLRRVLFDAPPDLSRDERFRANVASLADRGLTFDICALATQLPIATELVDSAPQVTFVLDHCGMPDVGSGALQPWRGHVTELARRPNVVCKISGLLSHGHRGHAAVDAVQPYVEHCLEEFGWDRVVWGSDWPLVENHSSLAAWVSVTRELVAGEHEDNQRKLFATNAATVYGRASLDRPRPQGVAGPDRGTE